jgi:hypothetical protein
MTGSQKKMLESLERLHGLYTEAKDIFKPGRYILNRSDEICRDGLRARVRRAIQLGFEINSAKMELFASGYNVPSEWVNVESIGTMSTEERENEPDIDTVIVEHPDHNAMQIVLRSMWNAILQLRADDQKPRAPVASSADNFVHSLVTDGDGKTGENSANISKLFCGHVLKNPDLVDLAIRIAAEKNKPKNERRSNNKIALEFTKETIIKGSRAASLLAGLRRLKRDGRVNL